MSDYITLPVPQFDNQELIVNKCSGEVFASQRLLGRICGVSDTTIMRWKGAALIDLKTVEIPTPGGLQGAALYNEKAILTALAKYNPELLTKCAEAGLRVYLHGLAGYKYKVKQSSQVTSSCLSTAELSETADVVSKSITNIKNRMKDVDPRLAQYMSDMLMNRLEQDYKQSGMQAPNALPEQKLLGSSAIAENLGYSPSILKRYSGQLGKVVKKAWINAHGKDPLSERRECGGSMRPVAVYPTKDPVVVDAIRGYLDSKL